MAINTTDAANQKRAEVIAKNEEIDRENNEIRRWNYEHRDAEPRKLKEYEKSVAPFYKEMVEAGVLGFTGLPLWDCPVVIIDKSAVSYQPVK
jgi:hypothetical protein